MTQSSRYFRSAFTLAEMLVVLAMMGMLAGILYTVTAPVRGRARELYCANNLKQIHVALAMYRADWGGAVVQPLPAGRNVRPKELRLPPLFTARKALERYLDGKNVWRCPNDTNPEGKTQASYTFRWPPPGGTGFPGGQSFVKMINECGSRTPIVEDAWHGYYQKTDLYIIYLRWDGSVKGSYQTVPPSTCLE